MQKRQMFETRKIMQIFLFVLKTSQTNEHAKTNVKNKHETDVYVVSLCVCCFFRCTSITTNIKTEISSYKKLTQIWNFIYISLVLFGVLGLALRFPRRLAYVHFSHDVTNIFWDLRSPNVKLCLCACVSYSRHCIIHYSIFVPYIFIRVLFTN